MHMVGRPSINVYYVNKILLYAVLWYGGQLMATGALTVGNLTSFSMYTGI